MMFGTNRVVGQSHFADMGDRLQVASVFLTIQGEGPLAGRAALFVRLSRCNLRCDFCDAAFEHGDTHTPEALARWENQTIHDWCVKHDCAPERILPRDLVYVITGGEPLLQNIVPLIEARQRAGYQVQIETNGLIERALPRGTMVICSPKAPSGAYPATPPVMAEQASALKFVLRAPYRGRQDQYAQVPDWAFEIRQRCQIPIYVSPCNEYARPLFENEVASFWTPGLLDERRNRANHEYAATYALKHGCVLNIQQHLLASIP